LVSHVGHQTALYYCKTEITQRKVKVGNPFFDMT
jgi:hypothetical protein